MFDYLYLDLFVSLVKNMVVAKNMKIEVVYLQR